MTDVCDEGVYDEDDDDSSCPFSPMRSISKDITLLQGARKDHIRWQRRDCAHRSVGR